MKKIIALLLIMSLAALPLSGCHGAVQRTAFQVPDTFDTSRDYTITFWAKNDTNVSQVQTYENAISAFEALYPNITVKLVTYTDYGDIYNDVIKNIGTDTLPNVCITYPDHIATYLTSENCVVPLDDLMSDEKYGLGGSEVRFDSVTREEMIGKYLDEGRINGQQYALPFMRSTEACYVNKTLLESLGFELPEVLTWDFVWEVCEYAMSLGKNEDGTYVANGQKTFIPFVYKSTDNMMITMLQQLGAEYSSASGHVLIFNEDTEQILYTVAEYAESRAFSTFKISGYPSSLLNAGQCIFDVDSTAGATWAGADAPLSDISEDKVCEFETVVMTVPQYDTENIQMISQGPSICVFNQEDDQEVLASWLFVQFLLTNEVQISYAQTEGYVPVTTRAQESAEYQEYLNRRGEDNDLYYSVKIDATKLLLENTENTFVTNVFNGSTALRSAAGQLIEEVTKAARRKETIDAAFMDTLQEEMITLYHLDEIQTGGTRNDLGALPTTSVILLAAIGTAWVGIGAFAWINWRKKRKNQ